MKRPLYTALALTAWCVVTLALAQFLAPLLTCSAGRTTCEPEMGR